MSMFILAIFCLTTSNLPWFMHLTFQVPMQYCSLQHWSLLPWPVTSTTGRCFRFGSISSFFLELFLHLSLVAYLVPTKPGEFIFQYHIFLLFHTVHGVFKAKILRWFAISFSAIFCFITSNLPWFMHLTFQVPMQYCSLQKWTFLSPPDTSTTGCCFYFDSASSFLL